jgi:Tol biopolymer transport system component
VPKSVADSLPSLSPDGKRVVFTRATFKGSQRQAQGPPLLHVRRVAGGPVKRLGATGSLASWSPDGRWIAFVTRKHGLVVIPAAGGKARTLAPSVSAFSWSPDSSRLAYAGPYGFPSLLATVALGGNTRRLAIGPVKPGVTSPQWSPDGTQLAFTGIDPANTLNRGVYVIGADGSGVRRVA